MIQCSFCSTFKSQRYLYTACQHFVCLNCAALRADQTLKCCNTITKLNEQVKSQLKKKKQAILNNLQSGYEYEKTDVDRINFDQLEKKLRRINQFQQEHEQIEKPLLNRFHSQQNQQINQEFMATPIDLLYKNPFALRSQRYQTFQTTPIKQVTNLELEQSYLNQQQQIRKKQEQLIQKQGSLRWQEQLVKRNIIKLQSQFQHQSQNFATNFPQMNQKSKTKSPQIKKQKSISKNKFCKNQFLPMIQNKLQYVRDEFKIIYDQVQKIEATMIYQIKIYFQEYINLLEKQTQENQQELDINNQKQRTDLFLSQFIQKWSLKEMKSALSSFQKPKIKSQKLNSYQIKDNEIILRQNEKLILKQKTQKKLFKTQQNNQNKKPLIIKADYSASLKNQLWIRQEQSTENIEPLQSCSTGRNLDKIFKKLQQSRSKLEQRINRHNWFMSDRCNAFSNKV